MPCGRRSSLQPQGIAEHPITSCLTPQQVEQLGMISAALLVRLDHDGRMLAIDTWRRSVDRDDEGCVDRPEELRLDSGPLECW